jgi:topoisomerase-4 subunit A
VITEVPYGTTTGSVIDSILAANDKGKIKIKKIEDNTAANVEIVIQLAPGISPDVTIDALYAFTACEVSISPNTCVIKDDKPQFLSVNDILSQNTQHTKFLLKRELEIRLHDLQEKIFFSSLLKIFIQEGMYKNAEYENASDFDAVVTVLNLLFDPFKSSLYREITAEDFKKLIDKPMSSITRFDVKKADEQMKALEDEIKVVKGHLRHLTDYAIAWYQKLKDKYGKGKERKTEIRLFDRVEAAKVALANVKLYMNREDGFIGISLRKDEFVADCSDIDEIIVFREDGKCSISKVADKTFVGKGIIHAQVFKKGDERTVYNMIYRDGANGTSYIKRFSVLGVTRDKEYDLTKGTKGSKVLYFSANPNGEAEIINVQLKPHSKLKKLQFDIDFAEIAIKGRGSMGNIVSKYPVKKVVFKSKGVSTLSGLKIWYDELLKRLNVDGRGKYLGEFDGDDKILQVNAAGWYELTSFDLSNHFDQGIVLMQKFDPEHVYGLVHYDTKAKNYFVKRFVFEMQPAGKEVSIISEEPGSKMILVTGKPDAKVQINIEKGKTKIPETLVVDLAGLIDVKGLKANGNRVSQHEVKSVTLVDATPEIGIALVESIAVDHVEPTAINDDADGIEPETMVNDAAEIEMVEELVVEEVVPEMVEEVELPEIEAPAPKEEPKKKPVFKAEVPQPVVEQVKKAPKIEDPGPKAAEIKANVEAENPKVEDPKPIQKIDLEITNPEDIKIDDKGQSLLF